MSYKNVPLDTLPGVQIFTIAILRKQHRFPDANL